MPLLAATVWIYGAVLEGETFTCDFNGMVFQVFSRKDQKKLLAVSGLNFGENAGKNDNGTLTKNSDGSVSVRYPLKSKDSWYEFTFRAGGLMLVCGMTLKPVPGMNLGWLEIVRHAFGKSQVGVLTKNSIWTRHANAGIPYEEVGAVVREFTAGDVSVYEKISGNPGWTDFARRYIALKVDKDSGLAKGTVAYLVLHKNALDRLEW